MKVRSIIQAPKKWSEEITEQKHFSYLCVLFAAQVSQRKCTNRLSPPLAIKSLYWQIILCLVEGFGEACADAAVVSLMVHRDRWCWCPTAAQKHWCHFSIHVLRSDRAVSAECHALSSQYMKGICSFPQRTVRLVTCSETASASQGRCVDGVWGGKKEWMKRGSSQCWCF